MKRRILLVLSTVALAAPALAHHSARGTYDADHPVTIRGKVTRVEWRNPHSWVELTATDANGQAITARVEMAPPNRLKLTGIDSGLFQIGEVISVEAWPARDPQASAPAMFSGRTVILPDGRRLDTHDAWGEQP